MACAYALCKAGRFQVSVFDREKRPGGVATSERLAGADINDGVQGGTLKTYGNVIALHRALGFPVFPVSLRVSFGQGEGRGTKEFFVLTSSPPRTDSLG